MSKALIISLIFHGAIVAVLVTAGFVSAPQSKPKDKHVAVNILTRAEFTRVKAGSHKGKKKAVTHKIKKKKKKKRPTPKARREATVKRKSRQRRKLKKSKTSKKKITKKSAKKPERKATNRKKKRRNAKLAKKDFDPARIASLLNKLPSETLDQKNITKVQALNLARGFDTGKDDKLTADDHAYIASRVGNCWDMAVGQLGMENIIVKVSLNFKRNGMLSGQPVVTVSSHTPVGKVVEETAVRAIINCQPYKLPLKKYAHWRNLTFVFDPKDMYRE